MLLNDHCANRRILVVDDNPEIHSDFRKLLSNESEHVDNLARARSAFFDLNPAHNRSSKPSYRIDSAYQGEEALGLVVQQQVCNEPYAMAFVDSRMPPGWDGIETVRYMWEIDPDLLVVFCTAYSDYTWEQMADALGRPDSFLVLKKPFESIEVRQMAAALSARRALACQVEEQAREIISARDVTVFALAQLADSRDPETGDHLCRMRAYAQQLALDLYRAGEFPTELDEQFLDDLYRATPLHDIGKVGIPDSILLKPDRLTADEFEIMKRHTVIGAETLQQAAARTRHGNFLQMAIEVARSHHERPDGQGYPDGLFGNQIPLAARIASVADVYDALTSARVYKAPIPPIQAREIIREQAGKQFDPIIIEAFERCFEDFLQVPTNVECLKSEFARINDPYLANHAATAVVQTCEATCV